MGKERCATFSQKSLASKESAADVAGGVCMGNCIEFIKYRHKSGTTSDSIVRAFDGKGGSGLTESLLEIGDKGISTHYSGDGESLLDLWGHRKTLEGLGYTVTVGNDTGANKETVVREIKDSGRFAFHLLYFSVWKSTTKRDWHIVALKGNGWHGMGFDRIFYAMDPNEGIWKITSTASLADWLWNDINIVYNPSTMHVITISK